MNDDWEMISEVGSVVSLGSDWGQGPATCFRDAVTASVGVATSKSTTTKQQAPKSLTVSNDDATKNAFKTVARRGKKTRSSKHAKT